MNLTITELLDELHANYKMAEIATSNGNQKKCAKHLAQAAQIREKIEALCASAGKVEEPAQTKSAFECLLDEFEQCVKDGIRPECYQHAVQLALKYGRLRQSLIEYGELGHPAQVRPAYVHPKPQAPSPMWLELGEGIWAKGNTVSIEDPLRKGRKNVPWAGWTVMQVDQLLDLLHTAMGHALRADDGSAQLLGRVWRLNNPLVLALALHKDQIDATAKEIATAKE